MHIVLLQILCTRLSAIVCSLSVRLCSHTGLWSCHWVVQLYLFVYVTCVCLGCPLPIQLPPVHTLDPAIIAKQSLFQREGKD